MPALSSLVQSRDIEIHSCRLFFRSITTRVPLKFGSEVTTSVLCARTEITVGSAGGDSGPEANGWGETPLSIAWVWPSSLSCEYRRSRLREFCKKLAAVWDSCPYRGHPMEIGKQFIDRDLKDLWTMDNSGLAPGEELPWLAALVCDSLFDIALHDAYGMYHHISTWEKKGSATGLWKFSAWTVTQRVPATTGFPQTETDRSAFFRAPVKEPARTAIPDVYPFCSASPGGNI